MHMGKNGMMRDGYSAPRTRPGKSYPGGKHMRRALARLKARNEGEQAGKSADHGHSRWPNGAGVTKAGSMK